MNILPKGNFPIIGSLSNAIQALVNWGKQLAQILGIIKKEFKGTKTATINNLTQYWQGVKSGGAKANSAKPGTPIGSIVQSMRSPNSNLVRVGYTLEFYNPDTEEYQTYGGVVDVLKGNDIQFIYDLILAKTVNFMQAYYGYKIVGKKQLSEILGSIDIRTLEIV